jgi:YD repeat-containing protein
VTATDGTVHQFRLVPDPQCQLVAPIEEVTVTFVPLPGTTASLMPLVNTPVQVLGTYPGPLELVDFGTVTTLDPNLYVLTLPEGRRLQIDQVAGLQHMADLNGNTLTITADGITHSSGTRVDFVRDLQGRITQIVDPAGNALHYSYDQAGDLFTFRDRDNSITTFGYNETHGLLTIEDPRGIQPIRNEYDDAGKRDRVYA